MNYKRFEPEFIQLSVVDSTNNYAANLIKATKVANGTAILTDIQSSGKGQRGNSWQSVSGESLTMSVIVYPELSGDQAYFLYIVSALAVRKTLEDLKVDAQIKWPNDLVVDGEKIGGILIENQVAGQYIKSAIIGIGVNLNQADFPDDLKASSVKLHNGTGAEPLDVFYQVHRYLDFYLDHLMNGRTELLLNHYYRHLYLLDVVATFKDREGLFKGVIKGIDQRGLLKIDKNGKLVKYDLKEISLIQE